MKHTLQQYKKKRQLRRQKIAKKHYIKYEQAKAHPSKIAVWCTNYNNNMNKNIFKILHMIFHSSSHPVHLTSMLRGWLDYVIKSKYYLFILITFLLLFVPVSWKESMALTNSDWWLNVCGIAFFLHTDLLEWIFNIIIISALMPLCSYLYIKHEQKTKIIALWILFIGGGYLADLIMCIVFSSLHLTYSVVGSSGGCCVLLGTYMACYCTRFYQNYKKHSKIPMYHKFLLFMVFALVYECYLDGSSLSHFILNPALLVHQIGVVIGILCFIAMAIFSKVHSGKVDS